MYNVKKCFAFPALYAILASFFLMLGCASRKDNAANTSLYERKPIKETTDKELSVERMVIEAKILQELDRYDEASSIYRNALQQDQECSAAHFELGRIMAQKGMLDSALYHAQQAASIDQRNVWYKLYLATLYSMTGQKKKIVEVWESIVNDNPSNIQYLLELSNAYLSTQNTKSALATLDRIEKLIGVSEDVSMQKIRILTIMGREQKATEELERLVAAMPENNHYSGILAESYMASGKYDKAKELYDRIAEVDPDDEYIHISLAEYYKAVNKPREAYEQLKAGFLQDKLSTINKVQILTNFYSSDEFYGNYSAYAFDLMETIMSQSEDSLSFAAFYGDVLFRQHKFDEAAYQFRLSLTRDSSKYDVWEALLVCELQGETEPSVLKNHAERAGKLFPLHPLPYYVLAVLAFDEGRYDEAASLAARCEGMGFDKGYLEAETYYLMALSYNHLDDPRSQKYYERYLALQPNDVNALNSYAYLLAVKGKELETAKRISAATLVAEPDNPHFLDTYAWILHRLGLDEEALKYIERAMSLQTEDNEEVRQHYQEIKASLSNKNKN